MISLFEAATLQACAYQDGDPNQLPGGFKVLGKFDVGREQGIFVEGDRGERAAVVCGSNERDDWWDNIDTRRARRDGYFIAKGFLDSADALWECVKDFGPNRLIGHSRAAAAVSILSVTKNIPAVAFAAPRTFWVKRPPRNARAFTVQNPADRVTKVPPGRLWFHVGPVLQLPPGAPDLREDHRIREYLSLLAECGIGGLAV